MPKQQTTTIRIREIGNHHCLLPSSKVLIEKSSAADIYLEYTCVDCKSVWNLTVSGEPPEDRVAEWTRAQPSKEEWRAAAQEMLDGHIKSLANQEKFKIEADVRKYEADHREYTVPPAIFSTYRPAEKDK